MKKIIILGNFITMDEKKPFAKAASFTFKAKIAFI